MRTFWQSMLFLCKLIVLWDKEKSEKLNKTNMVI